MTRTRLSMTGGLAVLAGIVLMTFLHQFAWRAFGAGSAQVVGPGMGMPHEMSWFMPLGPVAMVLIVGGAATLVVSLLRRATMNG